MFFGQVITAMVTPFDEQGEISIQSISKLTNFLSSNGTDAFVLAGTTGEGPTLTNQEKISLINTVASCTSKPIIVNIGTNNTKETINNIKILEDSCSRVDGLLVVCPYYNKPSQEGLFKHFSAIASSTKLPIIIYNIPGRTSVTMEPSTVAKLSCISNIVGIKESTGNVNNFTEILRLTKDEEFYVYSGDDNMTLACVSLGGHGVISVSSHIIGKEMQNMINSLKFGRVSDAAELNMKLNPFFNGIFYKTNPVPTKELLNLLGFNVGDVRLPLYSETTKSDETFLENLLKEIDVLQK